MAGLSFQGRLLRLYGAVNRSGLMEQAWMQGLFRTAYFFYKRNFEDPYYPLLRARPELFSGGDILDVGANIGYTAWVFERGLSEGCRVHAFEPEERNFRALERLAASSRGRIAPVRAAVGDKSGVVELWRNESHHGDHRVATAAFKSARGAQDSVKVPLVSVDDYLAGAAARPVAFIKIDVQGYELAVCEGMKKTLEANPRAVLAVEYSPKDMGELGFSSEGLLGFLRSRGYAVSILDRTLRLPPADDAGLRAAVAGHAYVDLLCLPR